MQGTPLSCMSTVWLVRSQASQLLSDKACANQGTLAGRWRKPSLGTSAADKPRSTALDSELRRLSNTQDGISDCGLGDALLELEILLSEWRYRGVIPLPSTHVRLSNKAPRPCTIFEEPVVLAQFFLQCSRSVKEIQPWTF
jgi:hypothetical protein